MLTFHIIYVPGTVRALSFFVWSLLKCSDCTFHLVANGSSPQETGALRELCRKSPRFELVELPADGVLPHGEALNHLQASTRSDHFCFMDSDMFATREFVAPFLGLLNQHAALFAGSSVWMKDEDMTLLSHHRRMGGRYSRTDTGLCLGSTYFAIYDNQVLTEVMRSTGIDFRKYRWDEIPVEQQMLLEQLKVRMETYDTGKLINLLLLAREQKLAFLESPSLVHIGGLSFHKLDSDLPPHRRLARAAYGLLGRLRQKRGAQAFSSEMRVRKFLTNRYFAELLSALIEGTRRPVTPAIDDPEIRKKIEQAAGALIEIHADFAQQEPTGAPTRP